MRNLKFGLLLSFFALVYSLGPVSPAIAQYYGRTPVLSVVRDSGDNYRIAVSNADSYAQITLYRRQTTTLWTVVNNFGTTDSSGYFSQIVNLGFDGTNNPVEQYVEVSGQQSAVVQTYPYGNNCGMYGCGSNNLTFSNSSPTVEVNQSININIYSPYSYSGSYYVSNNSSPSIASATISGSTLNLYGQNAGSATLTVCQTSWPQYCGSLYVTVSGHTVGGITFSENNVSLNVGQSKQITVNQAIYYIYRTYRIESNSNPSAVLASMSGDYTINLYAQAVGSSTIRVCHTTSGACGDLYVTVAGLPASAITFSDASPTLYVNQSKTVSIYSSLSGSFRISNNSNTSVVDANISGSALNLYGKANGSSTIMVCQYSNNQCGYVYVSVSGYSSNFYLSPTYVNVNVGQSATVNAYFSYPVSGNLYVSSNSNPNVASVSFSGSTIYVYGNSAGSTTVNICHTAIGQCNNLYVTVTGGYWSGNLYFVTTMLPQPTVGQYYNFQLQAAGGTPPYYYSLQSGNLPGGLSLSSSGQIFGTPQNTNSASFTIRVSDNYGRMGTASLTLTPAGGSVLGITNYNNGALISENGTVYIVYKNTKAGFTTPWVFRNLGYSFSNVMEVGSSGLADSGFVVSSAYASHPWGTWIKSGRTVYFVHEYGLIPISSYDTFINNGGEDRLVAKANSYDFQRSMLPLMDYNDARLR